MQGKTDFVTPLAQRKVTSYRARRLYRPGPVYPPQVPNVERSIDIHCHAYAGQQDAFSVAKLASESKMGGILFKDLAPVKVPISDGDRPARELRPILEELKRWGDQTGINPVPCWAGYGLVNDNLPPDPRLLRENLAEGVIAVWLPIHNSANSLSQVGGKRIWWEPQADPNDHTEPLPWDEALKYGFYMLDENGRLKSDYEECIRIVADTDCALFVGHATHPELWEVASFIHKIGLRKVVVDHPLNPFVDVSVAEMKQLAAAGMLLNFTYEEVSPLIGIDPAKMYEVIKEVGTQHCSLSSDAGEPLYPHSVECLRLLRGFMASFGMTAAELDTLCWHNPARIVGLETTVAVA